MRKFNFEAVVLALLETPQGFFGKPKKPVITKRIAAEAKCSEENDWPGCEATLHPALLQELKQQDV